MTGRRGRRPLLALLAASALMACEGAPSTLAPRGPAAAWIAVLSWVMFGLATAVVLLTFAYLLVAARRPLPLRGPRALRGAGTPFIVLWGIALPAVVGTGLMVANIVVSDRTYAPPNEPAVTVVVTGHKFWWEVAYPDHDLLTANELRIPVGEPVRLLVESGDVIHSFWVPQLHGKIDMVPGHTNEFWIQADEPGVYRGICAEYCGIQHAQMHFVVVAEDADDFDSWLAAGAGPPAEQDAVEAGRDVFVAANCVACHTVDGLSPYTDLGPALTDFAARRSIAAGMLPNERDVLAEWILDPQALKPGARMPPTPLDDADLAALLDFLETLTGEGEQ